LGGGRISNIIIELYSQFPWLTQADLEDLFPEPLPPDRPFKDCHANLGDDDWRSRAGFDRRGQHTDEDDELRADSRTRRTAPPRDALAVCKWKDLRRTFALHARWWAWRMHSLRAWPPRSRRIAQNVVGQHGEAMERAARRHLFLQATRSRTKYRFPCWVLKHGVWSFTVSEFYSFRVLQFYNCTILHLYSFRVLQFYNLICLYCYTFTELQFLHFFNFTVLHLTVKL